MGPLFEVDNIDFISLQIGGGRNEIKNIGLEDKLIDIGSIIENKSSDILDTLAVLKQCDMVISSCTSLAHMAGIKCANHSFIGPSSRLEMDV